MKIGHKTKQSVKKRGGKNPNERMPCKNKTKRNLSN